MRIRVSPYRRSSRIGRPSSSGARRSLSATTAAPGASTAGSAAVQLASQTPRQPVGRVEEDEIVLTRGGGCGAEEPAGVGAPDLGLGADRLQVGPHGADRGRRAVHERRLGGAARERLDPERAGAGEEVEHARAVDARGRARRTAPRARGPRSAASRRRAAPAAGARRTGPRSRAYCSSCLMTLITGATDGLGRALAHELVARGHEVVVHGRSRERAEAVASEIGGAQVMVADFARLDGRSRARGAGAGHRRARQQRGHHRGRAHAQRGRDRADLPGQPPRRLPAHAADAAAAHGQRRLGRPAGARLRRPHARARLRRPAGLRARASSPRSCSRSSWPSGARTSWSTRCTRRR